MRKTSAGYEIDPAELFRVFGERVNANDQPVTANDRKPPSETPITTKLAIELGEVRTERDGLKRELVELRQLLDDTRGDRDEWRKQAQQLALSHERKRGLFDFFKRSN